MTPFTNKPDQLVLAAAKALLKEEVKNAEFNKLLDAARALKWKGKPEEKENKGDYFLSGTIGKSYVTFHWFVDHEDDLTFEWAQKRDSKESFSFEDLVPNSHQYSDHLKHFAVAIAKAKTLK